MWWTEQIEDSSKGENTAEYLQGGKGQNWAVGDRLLEKKVEGEFTHRKTTRGAFMKSRSGKILTEESEIIDGKNPFKNC